MSSNATTTPRRKGHRCPVCSAGTFVYRGERCCVQCVRFAPTDAPPKPLNPRRRMTSRTRYAPA